MSEFAVRVSLKQVIMGEPRYIWFDADTQPSANDVWDFAQNLAWTLHGEVESVAGYPDKGRFTVGITVPF